MLDDQAMSDQWIIRVNGKEYGPAALQTLREWKEDGRVLPGNEARRDESDGWIKAVDIPGLFQPEVSAQPPPVQAVPRTFGKICGDTIRIYGKGFFRFLGLALLIIVPSICAQVSSLFLESSRSLEVDARMLLIAGFSLCMFVLTVVAWPIYIGGIQILTRELKAERPIGFFPVLNEAVKYWPRIALLCIFVYVALFLSVVIPFVIVVALALGGPSAVSFFIALVLAIFQVWIFGRLFINFMFWQQAAVLDNGDVGEALRRSKSVARSRSELPWYQRPLWRGVLIVSFWTAFVIAINFPALWPQMRDYWQVLSTSQDPQGLLQSMTASRPHGFNIWSFAPSVLQAVLRPLLGIAFVLLYLDARPPASEKES